MASGLSPDLVPLLSTEDPLLARRVSSELSTADVVIVGHAGSEIRRWLYAQSLGPGGELANFNIGDVGDVDSAEALESEVANAARSGAVVVCLGASHELSHASASGFLTARPGRGALIDLDSEVRAGSGAPVRALLERWSQRLTTVVLGAQSQHAHKAQLDYLRAKNGRAVLFDELRSAPGVSDRLKRELGAAGSSAEFAMIRAALDAVCLTPGVRVPSPDGLSAEELARFCEQAGRHPKVQALDLVGFVPENDESGLTARLAALCVWRFLLGVAGR